MLPATQSVALVGRCFAAELCMNTHCVRCWLWARKRLVRPGAACVQPLWGAFVRGNLPREAVGRALGGREPAKTLLLRSRRRRDHGCASLERGTGFFSRGWLRVSLRVKRYAVDERFALRSFLLRCSFFFLGIAYATICVGQRNARKVVFRLVDLQNTLQRNCVALLRCANLWSGGGALTPCRSYSSTPQLLGRVGTGPCSHVPLSRRCPWTTFRSPPQS